MVNTTTLSSFQAAMAAEIEADETPAPNPLAELAERMVRERSSNPESGDPFAGMVVEVEPGDAFGLVQDRVRRWIEDNGRWATEIEIRHMTDRLIADAEQRRPASEATYTVAADGTVTSFEAAPLPGMPAPPPAAEPNNGLKAPADSEFVDGWAESSGLVQRAITLIKRHPDELEHLHGMPMALRWKQKGGKSRGRPTMGQTVKTGGLLKHFSGATFVIWLAADHIRAAGYGDRQIEALLFRHLLAAGVAEIDEDTGRGGGATLVPPEFSAYEAEIRVYGPWEPAHKAAARTFQQVTLFDAEERAYFDAAGAEMEADIASGAHVPESEPSLPVCSVCNAPITGDDAPQYDPESPVVVLCESCGEDGVIDDGDDDTDIDI